jgi:hypothetical protein
MFCAKLKQTWGAVTAACVTNNARRPGGSFALTMLPKRKGECGAGQISAPSARGPWRATA